MIIVGDLVSPPLPPASSLTQLLPSVTLRSSSPRPAELGANVTAISHSATKPARPSSSSPFPGGEQVLKPHARSLDLIIGTSNDPDSSRRVPRSASPPAPSSSTTSTSAARRLDPRSRSTRCSSSLSRRGSSLGSSRGGSRMTMRRSGILEWGSRGEFGVAWRGWREKLMRCGKVSLCPCQ